MRYEADFPITHERAAFSKEYNPDWPNEPDVPVQEREELEDNERRLWDRGVDVNHLMSEMKDFSTPDYVNI